MRPASTIWANRFLRRPRGLYALGDEALAVLGQPPHLDGRGEQGGDQGQGDDRQADQQKCAQATGARKLHAPDSRSARGAHGLRRRRSYQGSRSSFSSQRSELRTISSRSSSSRLPAEHARMRSALATRVGGSPARRGSSWMVSGLPDDASHAVAALRGRCSRGRSRS